MTSRAFDRALTGPRNKNAIINGSMDVWQRGTSFSSVANGQYTADRWAYTKVGAMVHTMRQISPTLTVAAAGRKYSYGLQVDCDTADASMASTDLCGVYQPIEGYNAAPLVGGEITLSFWVAATKTGTYCVSLRNSAQDRSCVMEYTVNVADTWEFKTVTFPAPDTTGGTWDFTTGVGLYLTFTLARGSAGHTTAGSWQTGNYDATSNQVNACDSTSNNFNLAGVQLESGSEATEFEHTAIHDVRQACARYYQTGGGDVYIAGPVSAASMTVHRHNTYFGVSMRTTPTMSYSGETSGFTSGAVAANSEGFTADLGHSGTTDFRPKFNWTASAEL
jgi:hypothetical protein